jgi:hypothetical protein
MITVLSGMLSTRLKETDRLPMQPVVMKKNGKVREAPSLASQEYDEAKATSIRGVSEVHPM